MKLALLLKITFGFLALTFAAIGLLLPVWPTTPFVLVAIGCFSSTPKLRAKFLGISFFREYYESYMNGKGIQPKTLAASLVFLWGMLAISIIFTAKLWVTVFLLLVGAAVTVHIMFLAKSRERRKKIFSRRNYHED